MELTEVGYCRIAPILTDLILRKNKVQARVTSALPERGGEGREMRADNYHNRITRATAECSGNGCGVVFDTYAERPIFVRHPETEATSRDGYGPVTEFLAG